MAKLWKFGPFDVLAQPGCFALGHFGPYLDVSLTKIADNDKNSQKAKMMDGEENRRQQRRRCGKDNGEDGWMPIAKDGWRRRQQRRTDGWRRQTDTEDVQMENSIPY